MINEVKSYYLFATCDFNCELKNSKIFIEKNTKTFQSENLQEYKAQCGIFDIFRIITIHASHVGVSFR